MSICQLRSLLGRKKAVEFENKTMPKTKRKFKTKACDCMDDEDESPSTSAIYTELFNTGLLSDVSVKTPNKDTFKLHR